MCSSPPMTQDLSFIKSLSPIQEHFLRKTLLEICIKEELHALSQPNGLDALGEPFTATSSNHKQLPILKHFFSHYVRTFPLIASNPQKDQDEFWRDVVQPFVESFNSKGISESIERKELVTKRHQISGRLLSILILFYNSLIISKQEHIYLESDHLKDSDKAKLDKLTKQPAAVRKNLELAQSSGTLVDYEKKSYTNNLSVNIIAVDQITTTEPELRQPWNVFSYTPKAQRSHFLFVIQCTTRLGEEGEYKYESHFISRSYLDFKELDSMLRLKYPGLVATEVGPLPQKLKNDDGVAIDSSNKFHREKLRLALRGYLFSLIGNPEIAHSSALRRFLDEPGHSFTQLLEQQHNDYLQRQELEKTRFLTQIEFQQKTATTVYELSRDFEKFKKDLLANPRLLSMIFEQFSKLTLIEDTPPLLRTFFEWCKIEIAATLYQTFLSQDNSSDWYKKCQKFHRLFPYSACYTILKYTNPMRVVSKVVDLLLVNMPSVNLWNRPEKKKVNNLLSIMFVILLDEDLEDFLKERQKLENSAPLNQAKYEKFIERIRSYVHAESVDVTDLVKEEAVFKNADLLMTVFSTDKLEPQLEDGDYATLAEIQELFDKYPEVDDMDLYVQLKQLWQVEVRLRDKELIKQLWKEPELTRLIKKFLMVFYNPLMAVMKECDIHLAFRDFQHFMNDLMAELAELDKGEVYYTTPIEIFDRFKALVDKYEGTLWRFLRDMYVKDLKRIFLNLILWVEEFLVALQTKDRAPGKVTMEMEKLSATAQIDAPLLVRQLDQRIEAITAKRRVLRDYLAGTKDGSAGASTQAEIDLEWKAVNEQVFEMDGGAFGLDAEAFDEVRAGTVAAERGSSGGKGEFLRKMAQLDGQLLSTGEIEKLAPAAHAQLHAILEGLSA